MFAPQSEKLAPNAAAKPRVPDARLLAGGGRPLSELQRAGAERAYGTDLSHVRLHDGPSARDSADAMGARGWSWGEHVVLGSRSGPDTLHHELAHVVQQREAPAEGHLTPGAQGGALERDAETAAATGRPPELKASSRTVQMDPDKGDTRKKGETKDAATAQPLAKPELGKAGFQVPPLNLGLNYNFTMHLTPLDKVKIDSFLTSHDFKLMKLKPALDGAIVTVDEIVDKVKPSLPLGDRAEIERYVNGKVQAMVNDILLHPNLSPLPSAGPIIPKSFSIPIAPQVPSLPGPRAESDKIQGWQTLVGTGVQIGWHVDAITGKPASPAQDVTLQFQAARNFVGHPENKSGSEFQGVFQFGYNVTTKQVSPMGGVQFTEVQSLFNGMLQVGAFAQVLAGVAAGGGSVSGVVQPSIGAQAVVQIGKFQLGVQGGKGLTIGPGRPTEDTTVTGQLQWSF